MRTIIPSHRGIGFAICTTLLLLLCTGCKHSEQTETAKLPPFTIRIGQGGGFTGSYTGNTLHSNGTVERWRSKGIDADTVLESKSTDSTEIAGFYTRLRESGAFLKPIHAPGNMTSFLSYTGTDTTARWEWPAGADSTSVPPSLDSLYRNLTDYCNKIFER